MMNKHRAKQSSQIQISNSRHGKQSLPDAGPSKLNLNTQNASKYQLQTNQANKVNSIDVNKMNALHKRYKVQSFATSRTNTGGAGFTNYRPKSNVVSYSTNQKTSGDLRVKGKALSKKSGNVSHRQGMAKSTID